LPTLRAVLRNGKRYGGRRRGAIHPPQLPLLPNEADYGAHRVISPRRTGLGHLSLSLKIFDMDRRK
jgi:hypothetical protein